MRFVKHESHNSSTIKSQMKNMLHAGTTQWGLTLYEAGFSSKVEFFLKGSLDLIPSPLSSVKIQIIFGKVYSL